MKVEIISRETIKPSSPTPHHLRHFPLSFLDQLAPPVYVPLLLFYESNDGEENGDHIQQSHRLKTSLSETLTRFFPVAAGRLKGNLAITCNDQGVDYFEAKVNRQLSDVIAEPDPIILKLFLPCEPYGAWVGSGTEVLLAVQVNFFDCGGTAIGVCISHKIADASSLATFLYYWSGITRGGIHDDTIVGPPHLELASLFPPRDLSGFRPATGISKQKIVTKRFVFDASKLESLRIKSAYNRSRVEYPTRVETISTFILRRFMAATTRPKGRTESPYVVVHAVNLRGRSDPPLPEQSFGNIWRFAVVELSSSEIDENRLEGKTREEIRKMDCNYVRKLQEDGEWYLSYLKSLVERFCKEEFVSFNFSSWCRFGFYDTDFGWGKPVWVSTISLPYKNVVVLMDTRWGDGIEAWVNLLEEDMAEFERDQELLASVSPTPGSKSS